MRDWDLHLSAAWARNQPLLSKDHLSVGLQSCIYLFWGTHLMLSQTGVKTHYLRIPNLQAPGWPRPSQVLLEVGLKASGLPDTHLSTE